MLQNCTLQCCTSDPWHSWEYLNWLNPLFTSYHMLSHVITWEQVKNTHVLYIFLWDNIFQHLEFRPLVIACFPFVFKAWAKDSNNFCRTCSHRGRGTLWRFGHEHYFYNIYIYIYIHNIYIYRYTCVCAYVYVCVCICTFIYLYLFYLHLFFNSIYSRVSNKMS